MLLGLVVEATTLLFIVDCGAARLLAFCVDALCRNRPSLTILGDYAGTGPDDFPRFLARKLHCVGVNALQRNRIPIGVAGNGVVVVRQNSIQPVFSILSLGCSPLVPMVQSTDFSDLDYRSQLWRLYDSRLRGILGER
jgi:hypothetical protein